MAKNHRLVGEAQRIARESVDRDIYFVGKKPWYQRALTKMRVGFVVGLSTGLVSGLSAFGVVDLSSNDAIEYARMVRGSIVQENINPIAHPSLGKTTHVVADLPAVKHSDVKNVDSNANVIDSFKKQYPSVNFDKLNSQRDVSKEFIGKNNFIALAAEMEGFRGDLHKDPATGLNIGFGYNITKRVQASKGAVVKDLLAIGVPNEQVAQIVEMSQKPQSKLSQEIAHFNKQFGLKGNQLISMEQGVALLKNTQNEYKEQARASFPNSFDKMAKHQQEVLTYAAYKAGFEALSKYKKFAKAAENVYSKTNEPNLGQLKSIAKELNFYYMKDGKEMVLDERASLIAHTFVHQDYLGVQVGSHDKVKLSSKKLAEHKIDFSHLDLTMKNGSKLAQNSAVPTVKKDIRGTLDKVRSDPKKSTNKYG